MDGMENWKYKFCYTPPLILHGIAALAKDLRLDFRVQVCMAIVLQMQTIRIWIRGDDSQTMDGSIYYFLQMEMFRSFQTYSKY